MNVAVSSGRSKYQVELNQNHRMVSVHLVYLAAMSNHNCDQVVAVGLGSKAGAVGSQTELLNHDYQAVAATVGPEKMNAVDTGLANWNCDHVSSHVALCWPSRWHFQIDVGMVCANSFPHLEFSVGFYSIRKIAFRYNQWKRPFPQLPSWQL